MSNPLDGAVPGGDPRDARAGGRPVRGDRRAQVPPQPPLRRRLQLGRPGGRRREPPSARHRRCASASATGSPCCARPSPASSTSRARCGWIPPRRCTGRRRTPSGVGPRPTCWPTTRSSSSCSSASACCPVHRTPTSSSSSPASSPRRRTTAGTGASITTACTGTAPTRPIDDAEMAELLGAEKIPTWPSGEFVASLLEGLVTGEDRAFPANIPNRGQVETLPDDVVVECMVLAGADGVRPRDRAAVPSHLGDHLRRVVTSQELTVEAALTGERPEGPRGDVRRPGGGITPLRARRHHDRRAPAATAPWLPQFAALNALGPRGGPSIRRRAAPGSAWGRP